MLKKVKSLKELSKGLTLFYLYEINEGILLMVIELKKHRHNHEKGQLIGNTLYTFSSSWLNKTMSNCERRNPCYSRKLRTSQQTDSPRDKKTNDPMSVQQTWLTYRSSELYNEEPELVFLINLINILQTYRVCLPSSPPRRNLGMARDRPGPNWCEA